MVEVGRFEDALQAVGIGLSTDVSHYGVLPSWQLKISCAKREHEQGICPGYWINELYQRGIFSARCF